MAKYNGAINSYLMDSYYKPCKNPCKTVKINSHLRSKYILRQGNYTEVVLNVNPVLITTKSIMKTNAFDVINSIGSSLGLWLGFSIFTIFQNLTGIHVNYFPCHRFFYLALSTLGFTIFSASVAVFVYSLF